MEIIDKSILNHKEKEHPKRTFFKLYDSAYRNRFLNWTWMTVCMLTMGIVLGQSGPAFPDILILTDTDIETGSFFFAAQAFGFLPGALLSGFVHGKADTNILLIIFTIAGGVVTLVTPYCVSFVAMIFIKIIGSVLIGVIDGILNAEHMRIWGNNGQSLLQFMHFAYGLGGVIAPLVTGPFLAEKESENKTQTIDDVTEDHSLMAKTSILQIFNDTQNGNFSNATIDHAHPRTTNIHYAFLISGLILMASSIPFIFMFLKERSSGRLSGAKYTQEIPKRNLPKPLYILLAGMLCWFYIVYSIAEITFSQYLMIFLVDEFKEVSTSEGNYITTLYWAAFAAGRILSIFTSKFVFAVRLLYAHLSVMLIAYIGFTFSARYGRVDIIKVFTCLAGISMSAIYPAGFSWTESELLSVTGRISSVMLVGSALGLILVPYILGFLMENVSNMWFCYILLTATTCSVCFFLLLLLINRCFLIPKYGTLHKGN